jgi:hypothetical protein
MRKFGQYLFLLMVLQSFGQQKPNASKEKKLTDEGKDNIFQNHTPRSRDFHGIGHSLFFDLNLGPLQNYTHIRNQDTVQIYSRLTEYSLYHISYFFRVNVAQPDDDKAISITLNPGIGLGMSQSKKIKGFGIFTGGAYVGWERGAGSTYRSTEEKGRFIRLGAEYNYSPLTIGSQEDGNTDIKSWVSPVLSFGFRKENSKQNLVETNVKIGVGTEAADPTISENSFIFYRPFSLRISMVIFLDH